MSIEKRLERVEAILDARGLDWDHPRVASDHFADADKMVNPSEIPNSSSAESIIVQFGTGRIAVIRIEEKAENLISCGLVIRDSGSEHEIGSPVPGCSGEYKPKNGDIYLRFSNVESLQVVIEELETCKKLFESQAKETDAIACDHHICELAKPTGITCPPDSCDIDDGVRELPPADHSADASKMVSDEPAKEPEAEHPAGPKPDPGEGYRILSKEPLEDLQEGDEFWFQAKWYRSAWSHAYIKDQEKSLWYRRKIETPEPAWEPKVGDWVRVTRPQNWKERADPCWAPQMHHYDGKVGKIEGEWEGRFHICGFAWPSGLRFIFHRDWLSAAEPPASEKPAEPEYREPVLPGDYLKDCEFSDSGENWYSSRLYCWRKDTLPWLCVGLASWRYARIKKDA